ncbi:MAG: heme transporter CcmC, partial [Candidatus Brocadiales bacterium]|nr:heme transporter CcmC [Candidatus Bathyanammoxibius amoris]
MCRTLVFFTAVSFLMVFGIAAADSATAGEAKVVATIQTGPEWTPPERGEPLTIPEVHYRVKHSPYRSELVRTGQFLFNDASWGLQGEYSCAACHYERGQSTGLIWDLGDEGWGSWK